MAITNLVSKGISEKNRRLLTTLYRSVTGPFSVEEAAASLPFSLLRTHRFLAYLAERGWLVRIRQGLYAPIPLDTFEPGEWREDPWTIATKIYGPSYYIGGWTACEHWNLTEQIFRGHRRFYYPPGCEAKRLKSRVSPFASSVPARKRYLEPSQSGGTGPGWTSPTLHAQLLTY